MVERDIARGYYAAAEIVGHRDTETYRCTSESRLMPRSCDGKPGAPAPVTVMRITATFHLDVAFGALRRIVMPARFRLSSHATGRRR